MPKGEKIATQNQEEAEYRGRKKTQFWEQHEIRKIFQLYDEYGPQWNLISNQFPNRIPNSIKNRFYTFVRNLLKGLFRKLPSVGYKFPHQIPSIMIRKLYQAEEEFSRFKGLIKKMLIEICYQLSIQNIQQIIGKYQEQIREIYGIIFNGSNQRDSQKSSEKEEQSPLSLQIKKQKKFKNSKTSSLQQLQNKQRQNEEIIQEQQRNQTNNNRNNLQVEVNQYQTYQIFIFPQSPPTWFQIDPYGYYQPSQ